MRADILVLSADAHKTNTRKTCETLEIHRPAAPPRTAHTLRIHQPSSAGSGRRLWCRRPACTGLTRSPRRNRAMRRAPSCWSRFPEKRPRRRRPVPEVF